MFRHLGELLDQRYSATADEYLNIVSNELCRYGLIVS